MALTRTEKRLRAEVEEIAAAVRMDVWNIEGYKQPPFNRKALLEIMKDKLVRSHIILKYTYIDELLTDIVCNYYFHLDSKKNTTYQEMWKKKRFRTFVHYLMDETFLLKKLFLVEVIRKVPTDVSSAIKRINDVRNAVAHSLFPENRRRYMRDKKVLYSGKHLLSLEGIEAFDQDCGIAERYLANPENAPPLANIA
jgi:hypothetical protein